MPARVLRRLLAVVLAACALGACGASPASAAAPPSAASSSASADFFGANIQALIRSGFIQPQQWAPYLRTAAGSGLRVARFDAPWAWAQPRATSAYDWTWFDRVATALATQGIRWLPVVDLPPAWAKDGNDRLPPARYGEFAAFAAAFVARFGAQGSFWAAHPELPKLPVQDIEMWTEANSSHFWQANPDPNVYFALFTQVRQAIKAADPSIQVLVSLGWQDFQGFMTALYASGAKGQTDGIAFHPYAPNARGVAILTRQLRDILVAQGEPNLPIYMTEIGWPRAPSGPGAARAYDGPVSDASRAATTALAADALGASDCGVRNFIVYSLVEQQRDPTNIEDWLGLLNPDGTPTQTMQALTAATQRWSQGSRLRAATPALPLCHGATPEQVSSASAMAADGRLPIALKFPLPVRSKCFTARANYYGDPLEDVVVTIRQFRGRQSRVITNAAGEGELCLSAASAKKPFMIWGRTGAMAASTVHYCKGAACYPTSCRRGSLRVRSRRVSADRVRLTVAVRCGRRTLFGEPVKVTAIGSRGNATKLKSLLTGTAPTTFTVKLPPRTRSLKVRFSGDKAFRLGPRVRGVRLSRGATRTTVGRAAHAARAAAR
jgi:hypothetical protein